MRKCFNGGLSGWHADRERGAVAARETLISTVYVKPIGSVHTADLGKALNANFQNSKRGVGWGSISLARTRNSTTAGDPLRLRLPQTVQFRIVGAIEMRANSGAISMALQNWPKIAHYIDSQN